MLNPFDILRAGGLAGGANSNSADPGSLDRLASELKRLQERNDRLALICQGLWELLRERASLSDDDLVQRLREIDLRDGVADGRMTPVPVECPQCHRQSTSKREECLYCGARLPGGALLERL